MHDNLSEYELQRLAHIKRNHEMLVRLGLVDEEAPVTGGADVKKKQPTARRRAQVRADVPLTLRRSKRRLGAAAEFGAELIDEHGDELDNQCARRKRQRSGSAGGSGGEDDDGDGNEEDARREIDACTAAWLRQARAALRGCLNSSGERPDGADGWREEAVRRWGPLIGGGRVGTLIGGRVDESSAYPPASVKGGKNEGVKENVKMGMKEEVKMGVKEEVKMGMKEEVKMGVKEEVKMGVKEEVKMGVKEEVKMGVKEEVKMGVKEEVKMDVKEDMKGGTKEGVEEGTKLKEAAEETALQSPAATNTQPEAAVKAEAADDVCARDWEMFVCTRLGTTPPTSPSPLLQEFYCVDAWTLLCCCVLMSRVSSTKTKHDCISAFFATYPTPTEFLNAVVRDGDTKSLRLAIHSLGLFDDRLKSLTAVTSAFLYGDDNFCVGLKPPHKVHGVGKFGVDSFYIFCRDQGGSMKPEDKALSTFCRWRRQLSDSGEVHK